MLVLPDKVGRGGNEVPVSVAMLENSPDELEARGSDVWIVFDALNSVADEPEEIVSAKDPGTSMDEVEGILDTFKLAAPDEVAVKNTVAELEPGAAFDTGLVLVMEPETMPVLVPDTPNGASVVPGSVFALDSPGNFNTLELEDEKPGVIVVADGPSVGSGKTEATLVEEPEARFESLRDVLETD